jgi:hypothetical protein
MGLKRSPDAPPPIRSAEQINEIVIAAGLVEQARSHLRHMTGVSLYRVTLKRVVDDLVAEAASQKVRIANDLMQNHGRDE